MRCRQNPYVHALPVAHEDAASALRGKPILRTHQGVPQLLDFKRTINFHLQPRLRLVTLAKLVFHESEARMHPCVTFKFPACLRVAV